MKGQVFTIAKLHYFNGVVYATARRGSMSIASLAAMVQDTTKSGNAKHPQVRVRMLARFAEGMGLVSIANKTRVTITDLGKKYANARAGEKWCLSAKQKRLLIAHIESGPQRTQTIHALTSLRKLVQAGNKGRKLSRLYAKAIEKDNAWKSDETYNGFTQFGLNYLAELGLCDLPVQDKTGVQKTSRWTSKELEAAVVAYFRMLKKELAGQEYNKAEVRRKLRAGALACRTRSAVELRMQNISATLEDMGEPFIKGYIPREHVGEGVKESIRQVMFRKRLIRTTIDQEPTSNRGELDRRVRALRKKGLKRKPRGRQKPTKAAGSRVAYQRDPAVKAWVLDHARGICELCKTEAPFLDANDQPYLEAHHIKPLGKGGPDVVENVASLCPNCHQRCHHAKNAAAAATQLHRAVRRRARG